MSEDQTSGPRRAATPDDIPDQDDGAGLDDTPDDATPRPRRGASADEPPSAEPAGQESPSEDSPTEYESPTEHESADGQWHEQGDPADDQSAGAGPEEQAAQPPMIEDPAADDHPAAGSAAGDVVGGESPAEDTAELEPSADQPELDYGPGTSQEGDDTSPARASAPATAIPPMLRSRVVAARRKTLLRGLRRAPMRRAAITADPASSHHSP